MAKINFLLYIYSIDFTLRLLAYLHFHILKCYENSDSAHYLKGRKFVSDKSLTRRKNKTKQFVKRNNESKEGMQILLYQE